MSPVIRVPLFNLGHSLECGQAFGWKKIGNWYQGTFKNHIILIKQNKNNLIYDSEVDCRDFLMWTFRLDDDLEDIYLNISKDPFIKAAIEYGRGLRIMRQEPFKCLISYICSANSNILNIERMLANICRKFGSPIKSRNYKTYPYGCCLHSFPSPKALAMTSLEELTHCKLGFRAKYVQEVSKLIAAGKLKLGELRNLSYKEIRQKLLTLPGVGEKVADCVALFSFDKLEAFPVDVWIRRAMTKYYFNSKKVGDTKIRQFAHSYWGKYAGYAQEYIFYHVRSNPKWSFELL